MPENIYPDYSEGNVVELCGKTLIIESVFFKNSRECMLTFTDGYAILCSEEKDNFPKIIINGSEYR